MKKISALYVLLLPFSLGQGQTPDSSVSAKEREITQIAQTLFDAIPSGNKEAWERYVADDAIYTDENWHILTKKDLIDGLTPLPSGYSGSIQMTNIQFRSSKDAAVLSYRALEEESIFGQQLNPIYLITDTYFKRDNHWLLIASHVSVLPSERRALSLDPEKFHSFLGEYELAPGITYTVTLEGNKMMGMRSGRSKEELVPADAHTFFVSGTVRGEKVFVSDEAGKTILMLDRRENNDLVWKKVK